MAVRDADRQVTGGPCVRAGDCACRPGQVRACQSCVSAPIAVPVMLLLLCLARAGCARSTTQQPHCMADSFGTRAHRLKTQRGGGGRGVTLLSQRVGWKEEGRHTCGGAHVQARPCAVEQVRRSAHGLSKHKSVTAQGGSAPGSGRARQRRQASAAHLRRRGRVRKGQHHFLHALQLPLQRMPRRALLLRLSLCAQPRQPLAQQVAAQHARL